MMHSLYHTTFTDQPPSNRLRRNQHLEPLFEKLEEHAARWKDIGSSLGFTVGELNNIEANAVALLRGPQGYLKTLLTQWMDWFPGDRRGSTGYATLEGMKNALLRANLGAAAYELHL